MAVIDEKGSLHRLLDRLRGGPLARPWVLAAVAALAGAVALGAVAAKDGQETLLRRDAGSTDVSTAVRSADASDDDADPPVADDHSEEGGRDDANGTDAPEDEGPLYVDVGGAVRDPGLKELPPGARVNDALDAAGGLTENADERQINRAAFVADGEKVYVPELGESGVLSGDDGAADVGSSDESTDAININTADAQLLDELPGVGPATAQAIIKDREENGPFSAPEDIMRVSGIGEKKFEKMKDALCV